MSSQNITIQKNTGTINFYNKDDDAKKTAETVTIAAVDKYSTPLRAEIEMTPWGENMHRVSFLMKNDLLGQVLQQNYLTYKKEEKAKEVYDKVIEAMKEFKTKAEKGNIHSAILTPLIWHKMAGFESELKSPESKDLEYRFHNPEIHEDFMGATPRGLVIHPVEDHFPEHENIVSAGTVRFKKIGVDKHGSEIYVKIEGMSKTANKINNKINIIKKEANKKIKAFNELNNKWNHGVFDYEKFVTSMDILPWDNKSTKEIKRRALLKIRPMLSYGDPIKWASMNKIKVDDAINVMGEYVFEELSQTEEINIDDYDLFIFDADLTIWDGVPGSKMEVPFTKNGNTVIDANGQEITLKDGVREVLISLREMGKDVGLISKSEKEGVDYQDQPIISILKEFGLLEIFNEMIVIDREIPKSAFIPKNRRAIFIDDDIENLQDVQDHSDADVMDASVAKFSKEDILDFDSDIEPLEVIELKEGETLESLGDWADGDDEILIPVQNNVVIRARIKSPEEKFDEEEHEHMPAASNDWYKVSKRDYIPKSERPEKPDDRKEYELDHIKSKNKGGSDKKENLQWIEKDKHKKKSQESGDFKDGGDKKVKHEKSKGKRKYKEYQENAGKSRQQSERDEIGEKSYSEVQRNRARKRWSSEKS